MSWRYHGTVMGRPSATEPWGWQLDGHHAIINYNLKHLAKDPSAPNPQHIHVVVRTPNGNDYGKDLLRQHHALHPHSQSPTSGPFPGS